MTLGNVAGSPWPPAHKIWWISQIAADLWRFSFFSKWRPAAILDFVIGQKWRHSTYLECLCMLCLHYQYIWWIMMVNSTYWRQFVFCLFSARVINVWNCLPSSVNYSTLAAFRRSINIVDFSSFLKCDIDWVVSGCNCKWHVPCCPAHCICRVSTFYWVLIVFVWANKMYVYINQVYVTGTIESNSELKCVSYFDRHSGSDLLP